MARSASFLQVEKPAFLTQTRMSKCINKKCIYWVNDAGKANCILKEIYIDKAGKCIHVRALEEAKVNE